MKTKLLILLVSLIPAIVFAQTTRIVPAVPEAPSLGASGAKGVVSKPDSVPVVVTSTPAKLKPALEASTHVGIDIGSNSSATPLEIAPPKTQLKPVGDKQLLEEKLCIAGNGKLVPCEKH